MLLSNKPRTPISVFLLFPLSLLLFAYLYKVATRPSIPTHSQLDNPHKWGFPEWYSKDGRLPGSERDDTAVTGGDTKSILLFIDLPYDSPLIPQALSTLMTLSHDRNVELKVLSRFSPDWNTRLDVKANLEGQGCGERIWRISDHASDLGGACADAELISDILYTPRNSSESAIILDPRANITILPQPHHLVSPETSHASLVEQYGDSWEMGLFSHVLPSADPAIYYPNRSQPTRRSITYFPRITTDPSLYPKLPWGNEWSLHRRRHPHPPARKPEEDPLAEGSRYRKYWEHEESKTASVMRNAGICLFEGWEQGILDERMVQAMLSGCLVATVLPETQHNDLASLILPIPRPKVEPGKPPALPFDQVKVTLSQMSSSEMTERTLNAFIYAHKKLLPVNRARGVIDAMRRWEEGGRGYLFPHGWRWTCDTSGTKPPWC